MNNQPSTNVANPFGSAAAPALAADNAVAQSDQERAAQEVQAALVIAKKFPRNSIEAMERIINACTRPTLAEGALYSYQRGGTEITGPSIRLAETMAQEWGNMQFGIRELSAANGASTVEAFAWDMETNTRQVKVFQVPHVRYTRQGSKTLTDPRDIYELVANQGARRLRACILGVIPGDVAESAVKQCEVTQQSTIEVTPETIKDMLDAFLDRYGVPQDLIEKRIGRRAESINAPQMLSLRKIFQSLKDGMSKPGDWFEMGFAADGPAAAPVSDLSEALRKDAAGAEPAPAPEPEPEPEPEPAAKEKQPAKRARGKAKSDPQESGAGGVNYWIERVKRCGDLETLQVVMGEAAEVMTGDDMTDDHKQLLQAAITKRQGELEAIADQDPAKQ